jgi:hypothetical protein
LTAMYGALKVSTQKVRSLVSFGKIICARVHTWSDQCS